MKIDFSTTYLGMTLCSPLVASASPCTGQPDVLRRLEDSGAGAVVLPSLFEEQVIREDKRQAAEVKLTGFPYLKNYNSGADNYGDLVQEARKAISIPIMGSLNGSTPSNWVEHARRIADAGADALELNLHYVPIDPSVSGQAVEAQYLDVVAAVSQQIQIPLAVKVGPYFSSLPYFARQVVEAGANGLVLFNRFMEPDINLENRSVESALHLSHPSEARVALRWLGVLSDQLRGCSFAASGGIHSGRDALKAMSAGANIVMVTSALLKHGAEYLQTLEREMLEWLTLHQFTTVRQLTGSLSRKNCGSPAIFERANYAQTIASYMDEGVCSN